MNNNQHQVIDQGQFPLASNGLAWSTLMASLLLFIAAAAHAASHPRLVMTPNPGFNITWDGNNGGFSDPAIGAGPSNNVALASNGTVAFGSSEFGGGGAHLIANVNDGLYGNANSWIPDFITPDPDPFIGLAFASSTDITSLAWGRDNGNVDGDCCGGTLVDRNIDTYTLQYTQVASPDGTTVDTGDAATGWATIGTIQILGGADDASFTGYLRHRYDVSQTGDVPISATGFRIRTAVAGTCIDELEINPIPDPVPPIQDYLEITAEVGYSISWDGNEGNFSTPDDPAIVPENVAQSGVAFGSGALVLPHAVANINDGRYGNLASWISAPTDSPFIGINLGECISISSIAWGRDNGNIAGDCCGGTLVARNADIYTIQFTSRTDADETTPETGDALSGWQTIGNVEIKGSNPTIFQGHLRHRFDLALNGAPIRAAAIRIKVTNPGTAIDEIEINPNQIVEQELISIENGFGYNVNHDGNQGDFAGTSAPDNRALAINGSTALGSTEFGAGGVHLIANAIDGNYGNSFSWLSEFTLPDPDPFVGVAFGESIVITNFAFGRDNTVGGLVDRSAGTYIVQVTEAATPDALTPDTDDPATGWATLATIVYAPSNGALSWLTHPRHRFDVSGFPVTATGLRIKVSDAGIAIDELEVNTGTDAPPPPAPVLPITITPAAGFEIGYDGNDGEFEDGNAGAGPPSNRALATEGTVPFGSSELGLGHLIANINNGLYGNFASWISSGGLGDNSDPLPYVGLNFGALIEMDNIAWGRDNGDFVDNCCGGTATDRAIDIYRIQFTQVASPDINTVQTDDAATGWQEIGTVNILGNLPPLFNSHKRHRFELSSFGFPIEATGIRLIVGNPFTAIDEIEVNTAGPISPQPLIEQLDEIIRVTWSGNGILEGATSIDGPWFDCINTGNREYIAPVAPGEQRYFRLRLP